MLDLLRIWGGAVAGLALAFFFLIGLFVGLMFRPRRSGGAEKPRRVDDKGRSKSGFICGECHRELAFERRELVRLSPQETALVVRIYPHFQGRVLAEYVCPGCGASHYFVIDRSPIEWIGVDLYSPQVRTGNCFECRKHLAVPPWKPGLYDGRVDEAPEPASDYGLVCARCGAVVCVECVKRITRQRSRTGELICPRCSRRPVERFFHGT